jgi:hypothetical protein
MPASGGTAMNRLVPALITALLVSVPAFATTPDILINGGTLDFDYQQVPAGPITGHFGSSGSLVADPPDEGTAATTYVLDGLNYLTVVGALEDGVNFIDGAVIILADAAPIGVGTYPLDGVNGMLVFVDDAVGWVPPADLWNTNWTLELLGIAASGKYGAMSGTVEVLAVGETNISGTFEAMMIDPVTGVSLLVAAGSFNVESTTDTEVNTWGSVKELYR